MNLLVLIYFGIGFSILFGLGFSQVFEFFIEFEDIKNIDFDINEEDNNYIL